MHAVQIVGLTIAVVLAVALGLALAVGMASTAGILPPLSTAPGEPPNFLAPFLRQNGRVGPDGQPDDLCVWLLYQGGCFPP
jgi:hypothetical protein